ncbi:MAG TPA: polysaccharide biosynthesis protein [Syntrophomonadaceae bacterium]|nr:polysaccharide biosynthesis protein [Syntrophomonadaceae bacterium]
MEKQSTSKSFVILGIANIIVRMLAIVYLPFQAYILGYYGNGVAALGYNIWTFLFSLSNAGLPNAISKMVAEQTATGNFRAAEKILKCAYFVLLIFGIIVALFMALGSKFIATTILGVNDAYLMLLTISPTLIFTSISCALRGYYQGRQNMAPVAVSNVIEQFLNSIFTVVFAWLLIKYGLKYGVAGTAIGTFVGAIGAAGFLCFLFFHLMGKQRKREVDNTSPDLPQIPSRQIYGELLKYSLPAILNTIAVCASPLIDSANCISRLQAAHFSYNAATSLFGIYSYQFQRLFMLALSFSTALVTSIIPSISEALALENYRLVKYRISESYRAIYLVTIPSILGITFLAQPLITLVFYKQNNGADLVIMGTWTAIFMAIMYVQSGVLIARGKPITPSVNLIIGMAIKILLNYILIAIPSINIMGAVIGTGVGYLIAVVLNQIAIWRSFKFNIPIIRMMIRPTFASVIMGAICLVFYQGVFKGVQYFAHANSQHTAYYVINDITVLIAVLLGAGVYYAAMILIGGISKDDILRLPMGTKIFRITIKNRFFRMILNN